MLMPTKTKFRKQHKGRSPWCDQRWQRIGIWFFGLKAMTPERVTARQIEAARRAITRHMKRMGKLWIRIFPDVPVTKKPAEVRMGKGKGAVEYWICRVKPGRIMFELDGVKPEVAYEAFALAAAKLPVKTKIVERKVN